MLPCDGRAIRRASAANLPPPTALEQVLRLLTVATMLMTLPQVISVWSKSNPDGVSLASWVAYLVSSFAWLAYGIQKRDPMIYLAFAGWIVLDAAIVVGILAQGP